MYESTYQDALKLRFYLLNKHPFYASVAMKTEIVIADTFHGQKISTAATDGVHVVFNPDQYDDWNRNERLTVMFHEYMHIVFGHDIRGIGLDHTLWNIATDHVINNNLAKMGFCPVDDWLCDPQFAGWHEERVYNKIKSDFDKKQQEHKDQSGDQSQNTTADNRKTDDSQESMSSQTTSGSGSQSSGTDYSKMPEADRVIGDVFDRKNDDGSALSDQQQKEMTDQLREDLCNAKTIEKNISDGGSFSGTFLADRVIAPQEDWGVILEQWITEQGDPNGEFSWESLDRRALAMDQYSPDEQEDGIPWVVMGFDVSGSVCRDERNAFVSKMDDIRQRIKIDRVSIVPFSTIVKQNFIKELEPEDDMPKKFPSGGGTRFAPVFNWVNRQDDKPTMVIIFTDLGSRSYGDEPDYPVLWASSAPAKNPYDKTPPFGDVVEVEI